MYFAVCIVVFVLSFHENNGNKTDIQPTENDINDIVDAFLMILGYDERNRTKRVSELKDKMGKIDSYVVDRDKYSNLLANEVKKYNLNETNFYQALLEEDHFKIHNDTKSLYLKLKENMNRDDILRILSESGKKSIMKYARRMMEEGYRPKKSKEKALEESVDKYLAEKPVDDHKFTRNDTFSKVWDPQLELEDYQEKTKMGGRRIFRGERTNIRYYPFVVSIHLMGRFWCGGSIYHTDLIITSASCLQLMHNNRFFRENPRSLAVRVGSNHSRIGGELIDVLEVYFHPGYNPHTLKCNIALIRLVRHIKFNYHRVPKLIEISTSEMGVPFTSRVLVLGWGVKKTNQKLAIEPIFLQSKYLPIYPNGICRDTYGKKFVPETMFCAGTMTTGEGACDHDAGGPAVMGGKLVGIISFGPSICGFPDAPTVFTLVGAFSDWVETVNETMPTYYRSRHMTTTTTEDPIVKYFATAKYVKERQEKESDTDKPATRMTDVKSESSNALRIFGGSEPDKKSFTKSIDELKRELAQESFKSNEFGV